MKFLFSTYRLANVLNIDVALGAVSSALFFIKLAGSKTEFIPLFLLFSSIWIVYTVDRLLDVRSSKTYFNTKRHQFHKQYKGILVKVVFVLIAINAVLTSWVKTQLLVYGLFVCLVVGIYLLFQSKLSLSKEITICILYTLGCLLPAISSESFQLTIYFLLFAIQFTLIVFFNLLLFAWFDYETDKASGSKSLAISIGRIYSEYLLWVILAIILVSAVVINQLPSYLILLAAGTMSGMILLNKYFSLNERFRLLGDAVFYILLLYQLF